MQKRVFDPNDYVVRKVTTQDEFSTVVTLEKRVNENQLDLCAPEKVMRERFEAFPGAHVIYHRSSQGELAVGFRTYAPIRWQDFVEGLKKGSEIYPIAPAEYLTDKASENFYLLSFGILKEHRVSRLRRRYKEVVFGPSHQLIEAAALEARKHGSKRIIGIPATPIAEKVFQKVGFKKERKIANTNLTPISCNIEEDNLSALIARLRNS